MANVTVQTTVIPNYQAGGTTATIRIYATENFFNGGTQYVGGLGYFYQEVACTVAGTNVTVPAFTLASTTDSNIDTAKYIAFLYSDRGTKVTMLMGGMEFSVPPTNLSTTWQDIALFNEAPIRRMDDSYYTSQQVDLLLNEIDVTADVTQLQTDVNALEAEVNQVQADIVDIGTSKQDTLISGLTLKTVEGVDLLGSGNVDLAKGDVGLGNVDNTSDANKPVSTATQTALNAKQNTLVSGTNIKTVNGDSILGAGDLEIQSSGEIGSYFFDGSKLQHFNHGYFWRPGVSYSHFFWEFVVKPYYDGSTAWTGYFLSDNHGGAHNLLIGCQMAGGTFTITGNIWNGSGTETFSSDIAFLAGHWMKVAVGWDGSHIQVWVDGILVSVQAYSGTRSQPGGNNMTLHIGGSDHNMYWGNIAAVVGYEGYGRCVGSGSIYVSDYDAKVYTKPINDVGADSPDVPQFYASYMAPSPIIADLSGGFEGAHHHGYATGVLSALSGGTQYTWDTQGVPVFEAGAPDFNTYVPAPPATPAGALVWDSFSRANNTSLINNPTYPDNVQPLLGSTEAGSLGALAWRTGTSYTSFPRATAIPFYGYAALRNIDTVVETSTKNVDIRLTRPVTGDNYIGIVFRYKDTNDYYFLRGNDSAVELVKRESGVTSTVAVTIPAGWTTLRVVCVDTGLEVFSGTTGSDGTFTSRGTYTITNLGTATMHGMVGSASGKTVQLADDFLIKAA